MSKLKDFHVKRGHDYERIKNSPWYISELALKASFEVDNYRLGRNKDFSHVQELVDILEEYQLKKGSKMWDFPYNALHRALEKDSDKKLKLNSELALEMRLLRAELKDFLDKPEKENIAEITHIICDIGMEFLNEKILRQDTRRHGLVAGFSLITSS